MTQQNIEKAFADALEEEKKLKKDVFTKHQRSNLKNKPSSIAKKLETLWKLDKLQLKK